MICDIIESLPLPKGVINGLFNSWFTNEKVITTHFQKAIIVIGALKKLKHYMLSYALILNLIIKQSFSIIENVCQ